MNETDNKLIQIDETKKKEKEKEKERQEKKEVKVKEKQRKIRRLLKTLKWQLIIKIKVFERKF